VGSRRRSRRWTRPGAAGPTSTTQAHPAYTVCAGRCAGVADQ